MAWQTIIDSKTAAEVAQGKEILQTLLALFKEQRSTSQKLTQQLQLLNARLESVLETDIELDDVGCE